MFLRNNVFMILYNILLNMYNDIYLIYTYNQYHIIYLTIVYTYVTYKGIYILMLFIIYYICTCHDIIIIYLI